MPNHADPPTPAARLAGTTTPPAATRPARPTSRRQVIAAGAAAAAGLAAIGLPAAVAPAAQPAPAGETPGVLRGRVALVTGAARGIGRAMAVALARAGADVAVVDIAHDIAGHPVPLATPADLAETVRLVQAAGRRALGVQADTRDVAAMRAAVERTVRELGGLDVLVANAGINAGAPLPESTDAQWRNVVDVNVLGTANTIRAALPHMTARRAGRIVVTTSTFGRSGAPANANYAASKWALTGLVKSAALDLGRYGITVNAVAPTGVVTGLGGPRTPEQRAEGDAFFRTQYHALPVGALQPDDLGGAVVFLASDAARYVSGATLDVAAGANARYTA